MTRFFSLVALLVAIPAVSAQTTFGLRAGLNVATIIPDDDRDLNDRGAKLGFVGGVFAEVPVATSFSLQPEVLYTQKGVSREEPNESRSVDYLEVPVLASVALPVSSLLDVNVYAGPALAIKLSEDDDAVRFNSTNLGVAVGAGIASGPFGVDARYTFSVQDATEGELNDFRHHVVGITGVYRFGR
ncbi:MAG: porin family protein [Bacteroidota bacterium]